MNDIRQLYTNTALYEASKGFREAILRTPLGLSLSEQDIAGEDNQYHLALVDNNHSIYGIILIKPLSPTRVKFRQMAISLSYQGKGTGKQLMTFAEAFAIENGYSEIELNARIYAQVFYEKLGFTVKSEPFTEVMLPTILMEKYV